MKAIIKVHKDSSHAHLNGLTFEVKEVMRQLIALDINAVTTDFSHTEVLIVDFQEEIQKAYDNKNWDSSITVQGRFNCLEAYQQANKIKSIATCNCPA